MRRREDTKKIKENIKDQKEHKRIRMKMNINR